GIRYRNVTGVQTCALPIYLFRKHPCLPVNMHNYPCLQIATRTEFYIPLLVISIRCNEEFIGEQVDNHWISSEIIQGVDYTIVLFISTNKHEPWINTTIEGWSD